jgi:hypothetical protein
VSQDDHYTTAAAAAPVLKVKANPIGLPLTSASAVRSQLLPQPEKQLMFQTFFFYFYRDIIHWCH